MIERLTGVRLGAYEVRELLGSGGMASVYKGYDPALDREVAIKVISTALQTPDFVARFRREARVVANLRHSHIVQIYHFGEQPERGIFYMVQELLPGPTLEQQLRKLGKRRLAASTVQRIIAQLAAALDYAHGQGVIHRDIKPSNALYNAHDQLVLTDFGIARSADDSRSTTTGPGLVMGTPAYVAPEQAIGSATLTPACDVYALGVVLFELLTGQTPFDAETPMGVLLKHLYDEPPAPRSLRPDLPPAVERVVLRALDKEPARRHPSAGALAQALQAAWPEERAALPNEAAPARERATPKAATKAAARETPKATPAAVARPPAAARETPKAAPAAARAAADTPSPRSRNASAPPERSANSRKAATPPKTASSPPDNPRRNSITRLRVGLLTACLVGALILFGLQPDALSIAWAAAARLLGGLPGGS